MKQLFLLLSLFLSFHASAIAPITGTGSICVGDTTSLHDATSGGIWSSSNPAVATIGSTSGLVTGITTGTVIISYSVGPSSVTTSVLINGLPPVDTLTGGGPFCSGTSGAHIGLRHSYTGFDYTLYNGSAPASSVFGGTSGAIDFGIYSGTGTYYVLSTDVATGCTDTMSGRTTVSSVSTTIYSLTYGTGAYCPGTTGIDIHLSGSETGVSYQLDSSGVAIGAPIAGTGAPLDFGIHTIGSYSVVATVPGVPCSFTMSGTAVISVSTFPARFVVTGGGYYCPGSAGTAISLTGSQTGVNYQAKLSGASIGSATAGTGSSLDVGLFSSLGSYIVVATNADGCSDTMSGSASLSLGTLPTIDTVTGGGTYCATGAGRHIYVAPSSSSATYTLYFGSSAISSSITGTGGTIDFGTETSAGTYYVIATNIATGCKDTMAHTSVVGILPLPPAFAVTGGGSFCTGATGVHVFLGGSGTGTYYQLYRGGSSVGTRITGSGASIDFGAETVSGTYTVVATDPSTGCTDTMSGSALVFAEPLPVAYSVTGGGSYCADSAGVVIGLSNSDTGISYQLYRVATAIGSAISGTGSSLSFGTIGAGTLYIVTATSTTTGCSATMSGSATITAKPVPDAIDATTDSVCIGMSLIFSDSTSGGSWTAADTTIATISSIGNISGIASGNTTITYTLSDGCSMLRTVDVLPCSLRASAVDDNAATLTITPNPATGSCVLSGYNYLPGTVVNIYNITGQKVLVAALAERETTISVASLPDGMYLCTVAMGNGSVVSKLLVAH
jgi:Secretion system C-terminal sorting domain